MTELQQREPGRPCVTCNSASRLQVEEALTSGELVSAISAMFNIERSSLRRHRDRHMAWSAEQAQEAGLSPASVLVRLSELEERLREHAAEAFDAGNVNAHVRAAEGQRRALATMALLGGSSAEDIALTIATQQVKLNAMGRLMRKHPVVADRLAIELEKADQPAIAHDVRDQFLKPSSRELKQ